MPAALMIACAAFLAGMTLGVFGAARLKRACTFFLTATNLAEGPQLSSPCSIHIAMAPPGAAEPFKAQCPLCNGVSAAYHPGEHSPGEVLVDRLTKLPNRPAFEGDLCRRLAEFRRRGTCLSLLLIEIDQFKTTQQCLGSNAAAALVRGVVMALRGTLREMDLIARYGDAQFAMLLPATSGVEAAVCAKRVRAEVAAAAIGVQDSAVDATVSIGLTQAMPGDDSALVLDRADIALQAAMRTGGNCVCVHNGSSVRCMPSFEPSGFLPPAAAMGALPSKPALSPGR